MENKNILIGIDLGTTNSEIAVYINNKPEILKNIYRDDYTPSVFGFDKAGNKIVGKKAYNNLYLGSKDDVSNFKAEVKRLMGSQEKIVFKDSQVSMTPEEISAEILKTLRADLLKKYPEIDASAAVITVPAAFNTLQAEATKRAGNLAGFDYVVLLQEPIAASIAYGIENSKDGYWLVYDFGGGTFDVALVSLKEGNLSVLGNNGDNFLGGKNIDWEIVDKVIVPAILDRYSFDNFNRGNEKFKSIFNKLKYFAEVAKIELSQSDDVVIEFGTSSQNNLIIDEEEINISFNFSKKELNKIMDPIINRTIDLTNLTLKEAGVENGFVDKIILVGGSTQTPFIREKLEKELKIITDSSPDPLTIVAQGASIFAISQKIPREFVKQNKKIDKNAYSLELNYETLTGDTEQFITGSFDNLDNNEKDYFIQIQSDGGTYVGPKIKLKKGKFTDTINIDRNRTNLFWVYLFDENDNSLSVNPDSFSITHSLTPPIIPIPESIQVVLAVKDPITGQLVNECDELIKKGTMLPVKVVRKYKTTKILKKGKENQFDITFVEGGSKIPDRNNFLLEKLTLLGADLPYDLPEGTAIELTITIDESRTLLVTAYIPLVDVTIEKTRTVIDENIDIKQLEIEIEQQERRWEDISEQCSEDTAQSVGDMIGSMKASVKNAHVDEDEKKKANREIKACKMALDLAESESKLPQLVTIFNKKIEGANKIIEDLISEEEREEKKILLSKLESEGNRAIQNEDRILLNSINSQVSEFIQRILLEDINIWIYYFEKIVSENDFSNKEDAVFYIEKGRKAKDTGDIDTLKECINKLIDMLPEEKQEDFQNKIAFITKI